jgi:hypothetical protein
VNLGTVIGRIDGRFRDHLIDHHACRQEHSEEANGAELVTDTVELDHAAEGPLGEILGRFGRAESGGGQHNRRLFN